MTGYNLLEVGKLIKSLRKQRGLTQAQLVKQSNVDAATLSKIENGHVMPKHNTLVSLLDKLRFEGWEEMPLFLSEEEIRFRQMIKESGALTEMNNPENLKKLNEYIREIESLPIVQENNLYKQEVAQMKGSALLRPANMAVNQAWGRGGLSAEKIKKEKEAYSFPADVQMQLDSAIELYYEALRITIPAFNIKNIDEYYLSKVEIGLIKGLMNAIYLKGDEDVAINILIALEKSIDNDYRGLAFPGLRYLIIIQNLCLYLNFAQRWEESLAYSSKALEKCIRLNLPMVPNIAYYKGLAILNIIEKEKGTVDVPEAEEAKELLRDAWYGARLTGKIGLQRSAGDIFARAFKTKVDGTPLE